MRSEARCWASVRSSAAAEGVGGAEVGDEVCDGEVGFVADGGDDGDVRGGDGAGEGFVVEGPEVFGGAAAAGEDDEVDVVGVGRIEVTQAGEEFRRGTGSLHCCRVDEDVDAAVAAAGDGDDVADDGALRRGDDADGGGVGGERALAGGVEEAFCLELGFELFELELEGSGAARFEGFGDELELAARFKDGDAAAGEDGHAIGRLPFEEGGLSTEENGGELGFAVFEGEVEGAGAGGAGIGDFTFNPDVGVVAFELAAQGADEFCDGPELAGGGWFDCRLFGFGFDRLRRLEEKAKLAEGVCCGLGGGPVVAGGAAAPCDELREAFGRGFRSTLHATVLL